MIKNLLLKKRNDSILMDKSSLLGETNQKINSMSSGSKVPIDYQDEVCKRFIFLYFNSYYLWHLLLMKEEGISIRSIEWFLFSDNAFHDSRNRKYLQQVMKKKLQEHKLQANIHPFYGISPVCFQWIMMSLVEFIEGTENVDSHIIDLKNYVLDIYDAIYLRVTDNAFDRYLADLDLSHYNQVAGSTESYGIPIPDPHSGVEEYQEVTAVVKHVTPWEVENLDRLKYDLTKEELQKTQEIRQQGVLKERSNVTTNNAFLRYFNRCDFNEKQESQDLLVVTNKIIAYRDGLFYQLNDQFETYEEYLKVVAEQEEKEKTFTLV